MPYHIISHTIRTQHIHILAGPPKKHKLISRSQLRFYKSSHCKNPEYRARELYGSIHLPLTLEAGVVVVEEESSCHSRHSTSISFAHVFPSLPSLLHYLPTFLSTTCLNLLSTPYLLSLSLLQPSSCLFAIFSPYHHLTILSSFDLPPPSLLKPQSPHPLNEPTNLFSTPRTPRPPVLPRFVWYT